MDNWGADRRLLDLLGVVATSLVCAYLRREIWKPEAHEPKRPPPLGGAAGPPAIPERHQVKDRP